jgi:hypothetical protein
MNQSEHISLNDCQSKNQFKVLWSLKEWMVNMEHYMLKLWHWDQLEFHTCFTRCNINDQLPHGDKRLNYFMKTSIYVMSIGQISHCNYQPKPIN